MARPFVNIKDLNELSRFPRIGVRITAIWVVQAKPKGHLEMLVMDSQGDEIQVGVKKEEYAEWVDQLEETKTYIMENFTIVKNEEKFKACKHPYRLYFIGATTVRAKDLPDIPPFRYHFAKFEDILTDKLPKDLLIDVIAAVDQIHSSGIKMVALALKDLNHDYIQCTLWDHHAKEFLDYWKNKTGTETVVVIVRRARIKEPQGKYGIALANAYNNVTNVLTNQEIHEIKEFKRRFGELSIVPVVSSLGMTQMSSFSQFTDVDKFMYKAEAKSISEISTMTNTEEIHCVTVCDTVDFIPNKVGWFYDACKKCTKRRPEMKTDGPFKCTNQPKCNAFNDHSIPRYKLEIKVAYNEGTANFVFWDEQCAQIIGQSAEQLWKEMLELREDDRKSYPMKLDQMLEKRLAIRVKIQPKYGSGSVLRLSREAEYIQAILGQIGDDEGTSKMVDSKSSIKLLQSVEDSPKGSNVESDDPIHIPTQSLSAMADHDPEELTNVTPSKRVGSEELVVEDIPSAQLSSTKLKTIKTE